MEINCKLTYKLPEELVSALGINEDTAFETYFEDGEIHIHPLTDDELDEYENDADCRDEEDDVCDGNCEDCEYDDCCPYDDEDDEPECDEDCEGCRYFCRHCGHCILEDTEDDE